MCLESSGTPAVTRRILLPELSRSRPYCSIWRPIITAVVSATFISTAVMRTPDYRSDSIRQPTISPSARIGAMICPVYCSV